MARRAAYTAANLVQLRQTHIVCVLDNERVRVRDINAGLDNGGTDQNVDLAVCHLVHNLCDLFLTHFAVNDADSRIRKPLLPHARTSLDGLHAVVQVVYLSTTSQLTPDGIEQHAVVLLKHERLHRMAVLRRLLDGGHIADTGQRHVERARDRRCRQREHIHVFAHFLERFLVSDAEPLFLVHNEQTEILELDLLVEQLVRADNQIDRARLQLFEQRSLLRAGLVAREQLDCDGMTLKTLHRGQVMLPREYGRRYEDRRLLARENALHHGTQRDLGLAKADIAAQQTVHRAVGLHIVLNLGNAAQLVVGLLVGEILLELTLPRVIRREGVALDLGALGIEPDQPLGQLLGRGLGARLGLGPVRAAQLVQAHALVLPAADVFGDEVERGCRNIQEIRARKRNFDEIALGTVHRHALHADKPTDTVVLMHDKITWCQVGV